MAVEVLGEILFMESKKIVGILKYSDLESWELKEVRDLNELLEDQGDKIEIEILIGEIYSNLSNLKKSYKFFISYEVDDDAYILNKEGLIIQSSGVIKEYQKFPWIIGMVNNNNNIYFKSKEIVNSKKIIRNFRASSKIYDYSIKKTELSYKYSRVCLLKRIICSSGSGILFNPKEIDIVNIKFNWIKFYVNYINRVYKKILYGLFYEKKWNIFINVSYKFDILNQKVIDLKNFEIPKIRSEYSFYGDPFFNGNDIFLEALSKKTKIGEIIAIDGEDGSYKYRLNLDKKHFSYPQCIFYDGKKYCFPEMAGHSSPVLFEINSKNQIIKEIRVAGLEKTRLLDATYFCWEGVHYIFGGPKGYESECLNLYYSDHFFGDYKSHPSNPIVMNPDNARMGGAIIEIDGKIFRVGQYNRGGYGEKIKIMQIVSINKNDYVEIEKNEIVISQGKGPHTLNFSGSKMVGDFYVDKFSILAGMNRLIACIKS
jgi:hypothetical protein